MNFTQKERYNMQDLLQIIEVLRAPGGCPWDREQTHASIRANLIEETYEVAEAIDEQNSALLQEELGDLLLQIVLHAQIEQEADTFTFEDVCNGICQKLVYRHPHVFGDVQLAGASEVIKSWEALKNAEKSRITAADRLDSVPKNLPALMRAAKLQKRADDLGFGYLDASVALADLKAEVAELEEAMVSGQNLPHEIGDVLFSAANLARLSGVDGEEALAACSARFIARVKKVEELAQAQQQELSALNTEMRHVLWKEAKCKLQQG